MAEALAAAAGPRGAVHGGLCLAVKIVAGVSAWTVAAADGRLLPVDVPQRHAGRDQWRRTRVAMVATCTMSAARCARSPWERFAGQLVQVLLTVLVLLVLPSAVHSFMPLVAIGVVVGVFGIMLVARARPDVTRSAWARLLSRACGDIRDGLLAEAWLGITLASALGVGGHAAAFLIAARNDSSSAPPLSQMLPIAFFVMAAMMLPRAPVAGSPGGVTACGVRWPGLGARRGSPPSSSASSSSWPVSQAPQYHHRLVPSRPISAARPDVRRFEAAAAPSNQPRRPSALRRPGARLDRPSTLLSTGMSINGEVD